MDIVVTLPGGKRVDARAGRFTVHTDQPRAAGGDESAPDPFTLFLASLATCCGFYVAAFCQARGIATDGIRLVQRSESDARTKRLARVTVEIELPPSFPSQYRDAVVRAAGACRVKKAIFDPPEVAIVAATGGDAVEAPAR